MELKQLVDELNYDFYSDKVCSCGKFSVFYGKPPNYPYSMYGWNGVCRNCDKLPPMGLAICKSCTSVFYFFAFNHHDQIPNYDNGYCPATFCWHCLQEGVGPKATDSLYKRLPTVVPDPLLLNPKCPPLSATERASIKQARSAALLDSIFDLLED